MKKINRLPAVLWIRIQITEIRSVVCSFGDQDSQRLKKDTLEAKGVRMKTKIHNSATQLTKKFDKLEAKGVRMKTKIHNSAIQLTKNFFHGHYYLLSVVFKKIPLKLFLNFFQN